MLEKNVGFPWGWITIGLSLLVRKTMAPPFDLVLQDGEPKRMRNREDESSARRQKVCERLYGASQIMGVHERLETHN